MATKDKLVSLNGLKAAVDKIKNLLSGKQDKLTAGTGISISNNTISSTDYSTLYVGVHKVGNNYSIASGSQNLSLNDIRNAFVAGRDVVLHLLDKDNGNQESAYCLTNINQYEAYFISNVNIRNANIKGFIIYPNQSGKITVHFFDEYLAKTSALSSKQNTISDLATIRSNASNGNTALAKIGDLSVYGQPTVVDLISNLSSIIVRDINEAPSLALRRLFVNAGAVYDENTGYYKMNGLTNITEEQMIRIYNNTYHKFYGHDISYGLYGSTVRTTFKVLQRPTWIRGINGNNLFAGCTSLEVVNIGTENNQTTTVRDNNCTWSDMTAMFANCYNLKTITGAIQPDNSSVSLADCFFNCPALQNVYLLNLSQNVSFADSHYLSIASVTTMIRMAATSPNIIITLAANVYADAMANSSVISALNSHTNVSLASA